MAISAVSIVALLAINISGQPFQYPPNKQYEQVKSISEFILEKAGGKPFNFALITGGNSDHAYRYIFEVEGNPPVTTFQFVPLFVVRYNAVIGPPYLI